VHRKLNNMFKKIINKFFSRFFYHLNSKIKTDYLIQNLFNSGHILAEGMRSKTIIENLTEVEFKVFSQFGEDGIIDWLINCLPDTLPKKFIEFGVADYEESNTKFLLMKRNWSGLIIEGNKEYADKIMDSDYFWKYDLDLINTFIDSDNIENLIQRKFSSDIGLLSIDIDGNDLWIWRNIKKISPVIVVIEFNSIFGDKIEVTTPYRDNFNRFKYHYSGLCFGASLQALITTGKEKGYTFIGTGSYGVNGFFIKNEYLKYIDKRIKKFDYFLAKTRESRDVNGNLNYLNREQALIEIGSLHLYNLKTNSMMEFKEIHNRD